MGGHFGGKFDNDYQIDTGPGGGVGEKFDNDYQFQTLSS